MVLPTNQRVIDYGNMHNDSQIRMVNHVSQSRLLSKELQTLLAKQPRGGAWLQSNNNGVERKTGINIGRRERNPRPRSGNK